MRVTGRDARRITLTRLLQLLGGVIMVPAAVLWMLQAEAPGVLPAYTSAVATASLIVVTLGFAAQNAYEAWVAHRHAPQRDANRAA